jgi:hypothetical protein
MCHFNARSTAFVFDRLTRPAPKPAHRPDDVMRAGAFLWRDMVIGVHGADKQGDECLIDPKSSQQATSC